MFDSLDEQMKHDEAITTSPKERLLQRVLMAVVIVLVCGGIVAGVAMLG